MPIPAEIHGQKYISLVTFKRDGTPIATPIWFAESDGKLYFMTRSDSGKYKRIRNSPRVKIAPSTIRGKVTGPEFPATARILPESDWGRAFRFYGASSTATWKSLCPDHLRYVV
jgi:uncharacterized protein